MHTRSLLSLLFVILLSVSVCGQEHDFSNPGGESAVWSLYAYNTTTNEVVVQTPQFSLTPASVIKLVTSATALEVLGSDHRFVTTLKYSGNINHETGTLNGDLYIIGGGDPVFYSKHFKKYYESTFESWGKALKEIGISKVEGDIIVDASIINDEPIPGGWIWEDIGNYYGAGVYGLSYSDNIYEIHFSTGIEAGKKAKLERIEPNIEGLELENNVRSSTINRDMAYIYSPPGSFKQVIRGSIPRNKTDFIVKGAMPSPPVVASRHFKEVLGSLDITIAGGIKKQKRRFGIQVNEIANKKSPPLKDIVKALNINSNNLYAEHLIREIGRFSSGNSSLNAGLEKVVQFWKNKNIFLDGFYMTDGSGLSRSNAICTRTLVEVMLYMKKSDNSNYFFSSLPLAGRDGTMRYFFIGSVMENKLKAKTGSMNRVRSLAGVFKNNDDEEIIFAVIVNNFKGSSYEMGKKLEPIVIRLSKLCKQD